jgi:peptidoglycan/LPS O-acetylase OafA/YrhL
VTTVHPSLPADDVVADRAFPTLNAVRAIGALMVVVTHVAFNTGQINQGWLGAVTSRLDFGVTLFFVLSGFLLARPWFLDRARGHAPPSTTHYLWKRALRILPLYWVVVVAAFLVDPENADASRAEWLSTLTLTQIYGDGLLASSLTQMWSLCTEVAFYVVLPLLCLLLLARPGRGATGGLDLRAVTGRTAVLVLLGFAWQVAVSLLPGTPAHAAQWLPGLLPWFLVGTWFAAVSAHGVVSGEVHLLDRLGRDLAGCWILAAAVFAIACSPIGGPRVLIVPGAWESLTKLALYTVAGAFFVLPLVFGPERDGTARRLLTGPVLFWLGEISYGIFAIHMLVLTQVFRLSGLEIFTGGFGFVLAATLAVTIPLAAISFRLLERPVLRWKNARFVTHGHVTAAGPYAPGPDPASEQDHDSEHDPGRP